MASSKVNSNGYSEYVNRLVVTRQHNTTARESATGMLIVKRKSTVRILEVGIIPLDSAAMVRFMNDINKPNCKVSFLDSLTNTMVENMPCLISANTVEYYTINAANGVKFHPFTIDIQEVKEAR